MRRRPKRAEQLKKEKKNRTEPSRWGRLVTKKEVKVEGWREQQREMERNRRGVELYK